MISLIYFFPVFWIILTAFKSRGDTLAVPPVLFFQPIWDNFVSVFYRASITAQASQETQFLRYFFNSMFISGTSVLLALIIGCLAAYGFSRFPLKGNDTYLFIILTTRMMPAIVVIIPIFLMFRLAGLAGTYVGIILLYTAFNIPFSVWMIKSFFDELNREVEDAARMDGSSEMPRLLQDLPAPGHGRPRRHLRLRPDPDLERVPVRAPAHRRRDAHGAGGDGAHARRARSASIMACSPRSSPCS